MFDLSVYKRIRVEPLTGVIGAEIFGVDVKAVDEATFAEIRRAFGEHSVIFFRDQELEPRSFADFMQRFGPLTLSPQSKRDGEDGMVHRLHRAPETPRSKRNLGDRWHCDQSSRERPNMAAALYCLEAPPYGGDTLFASLTAAYADLSPGMKALCDPLIGLHSLTGVYGHDGMGGTSTTRPFMYEGVSYNETYSKLGDEALALIRAVYEHPLVCTHPDTGRPYLYVTGNHMVGIKDMSDLESRPLIDRLGAYITRPEFTCRFRWKKGSIAIWDNRSAQHYAVNDYEGFARTMLRVELDGGRPFGPAKPLPEAEPRLASA
jgi:taurine dioxygenase